MNEYWILVSYRHLPSAHRHSVDVISKFRFVLSGILRTIAYKKELNIALQMNGVSIFKCWIACVALFITKTRKQFDIKNYHCNDESAWDCIKLNAFCEIYRQVTKLIQDSICCIALSMVV